MTREVIEAIVRERRNAAELFDACAVDTTDDVSHATIRARSRTMARMLRESADREERRLRGE